MYTYIQIQIFTINKFNTLAFEITQSCFTYKSKKKILLLSASNFRRSSIKKNLQIIHNSLLCIRNYAESNLYKKHIFLGLLIKKSLMKLKITLQSSASTDILQVCFFLLISKLLQPKFKISNKALCYYVSSQIVLQTFVSFILQILWGKLRCIVQNVHIGHLQQC